MTKKRWSFGSDGNLWTNDGPAPYRPNLMYVLASDYDAVVAERDKAWADHSQEIATNAKLRKVVEAADGMRRQLACEYENRYATPGSCQGRIRPCVTCRSAERYDAALRELEEKP